MIGRVVFFYESLLRLVDLVKTRVRDRVMESWDGKTIWQIGSKSTKFARLQCSAHSVNSVRPAVADRGDTTPTGKMQTQMQVQEERDLYICSAAALAS
jgi:hypothetical protein